MITKSALAHLLLVLACLHAVNSQCITFYRDYNQQGDSFRLCQSGNIPANWNDQASSFVVPNGYTVQLYADFGFGGQAFGPYKAGSYNVPDNFNDQLSSARIARAQGRPSRSDSDSDRHNRDSDSDNDNSQCVKFYADYDQKGRSFQLCKSGDVPAAWNDQASSFVVPRGYSVQLFQDYGFGGQSLGPYTAGSYNVPSNFNDQLSSARISAARPQPPSRNCPTFYTQSGQRGDSFQLCSSGDVPDKFNNRASSFYVPRGYVITLYQHDDLEGESRGPYQAGTYDMPKGFDNRLTSVRVNRRR